MKGVRNSMFCTQKIKDVIAHRKIGFVNTFKMDLTFITVPYRMRSMKNVILNSDSLNYFQNIDKQKLHFYYFSQRHTNIKFL